jgi:hypothetical protein
VLVFHYIEKRASKMGPFGSTVDNSGQCTERDEEAAELGKVADSGAVKPRGPQVVPCISQEQSGAREWPSNSKWVWF